MSKGLERSIRRGPLGPIIDLNVAGVAANLAEIDQIKNITFDLAKLIQITGVAAAVDAGTAVIGALPEGNLLFLGAVATVNIEATGDASVLDNWAGDFALGSEPNADLDLGDAGEANIIPSSALLAGASDKIAATVIANSTVATEQGLIIDNTAADKNLNFNLLIDDNFITDTEVGDFNITGTITMSFKVLGDD